MSIRKLNTKTKLPASYYRSLRTEKKFTKFVSETKTQKGGWGGGVSKRIRTKSVFVVQFLRVYFWVN